MNEKQEIILACSDVHISMTDRRWLDWVDYALNVAGKIVLVGDTVDSVRFKKEDLFNSNPGIVLLAALRRLIESGKCFLVCGNHDPELSNTVKELFGIEVETWKELRIGDVLFVHGHQFDPILRYLPWRLFEKVVPRFVKPPSFWKCRNRQKWYKRVGLIYSNVYDYLENNKFIKLIVIGHTHYASYHMIETGQKLADCGDWVDSKTWLEICGTDVEIKFWR